MTLTFVHTDTILDRILAEKVSALALVTDVDRAAMREAALATAPPRDFAGALRVGNHVALIAEVKHASPSKGVLIDPFDPVLLATTYAEHGAAAISVLTDTSFFGGHLDHLRAVRAGVGVPLLRKDFIIDAYAIDEARAAGADAILLIAAALIDAQLADLHAHARGLGLSVLVEVHDEAELERALAVGAALIGVNNRDLHSFREDLGTFERLAKRAPGHVTLVAESSIRTLDDVRRMSAAGASAILVGEGLVKAGGGNYAAIGAQVRAFTTVGRLTGEG